MLLLLWGTGGTEGENAGGKKGVGKRGRWRDPPWAMALCWAALTAQIPTQLLSQGEFPTAAELLCALGEVPIIRRGSRKARSIPEGRKIQEIPSSGGPSPSSALADRSACFALALFSAGPQGWVHLWVTPHLSCSWFLGAGARLRAEPKPFACHKPATEQDQHGLVWRVLALKAEQTRVPDGPANSS